MKQSKNLTKAIRNVVKRLFMGSISYTSAINIFYDDKRISSFPDFWEALEYNLKTGKVISAAKSRELIGIREISLRKIQINELIEESNARWQISSYENILRQAAAIHELSLFSKQVPFLAKVFIPAFNPSGAKAFIKILQLIKNKKEHTNESIKREDVFELIVLWELFIQIEHLDEMEDALINGYHYLDVIDNSLVVKSADDGKMELNDSHKQYFRRVTLSRLSKPIVSNENQLKNNDGELKTDVGLATILISGGEITSDLPPGTTFLKVENLKAEDEHGNVILPPDAISKLSRNQINFNYRNFLQDHFIPKEEDDMNQLFVSIPEFDNEKIPVKAFLLIGGWLHALSTLYVQDLMTSNDFSVPRLLKWYLEENKISDSSAHEDLNGLMVDYLASYERLTKPDGKISLLDNILKFTEVEILALFKGNDDFQGLLTDKKLIELMKFMAKHNYSGFTFSNEKFYLMPRVLAGYDSLTEFYNHVVLKNLYRDEEDRKDEVASNHMTREKIVCDALAKLFSENNLSSQSRVNFRYKAINPGDLRGEFDVIVADPKNKTILLIEVKLKNTHVDTRFQKQRWINDRILGINKKKRGAIQQVSDYLKYFRQSDCGKALIKELFNIDSVEGFEIVPLIVTDNFFVDHDKAEIPLFEGEQVAIVSFHELKMLLNGIEPFDYKYPWWGIYHLNKILVKNPDNFEAKEYLGKINHNAVQLTNDTIEFIEKNKIPFWEHETFNLPELLNALKTESYWQFLEWFPMRKPSISTTRFQRNVTMQYH